MRRGIAWVILVALASPAVASTTMNNDDSCDISVSPAATLLVPFFEVSIPDANKKTLFTITNVTSVPQIAHVTVWTDWAFPVLAFNLFLTGYDVQAIDLYDVIVRGVVAPPSGTSATDPAISPRPETGVPYALSARNGGNPNISADAVAAGGSCSRPISLPNELMDAVRAALTFGLYNPLNDPRIGCGNRRVGGTHTTARGYLTIDVVNTCTPRYPDDPEYLKKELLFDNALIGDYQQIDADAGVGNFAQGNPMVHIRAIPEGGRAGSFFGTTLPYTFYDRYTTSFPPSTPRTFDRRQPLPSTFAARWIEGGLVGFNTSYKIWREGLAIGTQNCSKAADNSAMELAQMIRLDERENSFGFSVYSLPHRPTLPGSAQVSTANTTVFPANGSTVDISGWMFLNLNNGGSAAYSANGYSGRTPFAPDGAVSVIFGVPTVTRASQNWVTVTMSAQGRYSVEYDAVTLGNGCTPAGVLSAPIAPAGGVLVCPPGISGCTPGVPPYAGTNTTPSGHID